MLIVNIRSSPRWGTAVLRSLRRVNRVSNIFTVCHSVTCRRTSWKIPRQQLRQNCYRKTHVLMSWKGTLSFSSQ